MFLGSCWSSIQVLLNINVCVKKVCFDDMHWILITFYISTQLTGNVIFMSHRMQFDFNCLCISLEDEKKNQHVVKMLKIYFLSFQCSVSCGVGTRKRMVKCLDDKGNERPDEECPGEKPKTTKRCKRKRCPKWFAGPWSRVRTLHLLLCSDT